MIGFRANLSTQDVMIQLKHDVVDPGHGTGTKAVLGLDLNKAFDNVSHEAILNNLSEIGPGVRTFRYIRSFLEGRTAEISIGDIKSDSFALGGKGTPQGSVLSPFLFNIALIKIPPRLEEIPGLKHTFYADDITLWVTRGSDAHLEETLQQAVNIVEELAGEAGLACSQPKSELFVVRDKPRGLHARHYIPPPPLEVKVGGRPVAEAQTIRILGLYLQTNKKNRVALEKLKTTVNATVRLIRRIANRKSGVKEKELCKLVQAFVLSRITYATPYMKLDAAEKVRSRL
uniref:Putative tick transposon n=1 Tax=Rhipicephalus microplus TaxID=6941 RepID=A0A6G5A918_RHIMP